MYGHLLLFLTRHHFYINTYVGIGQNFNHNVLKKMSQLDQNIPGQFLNHLNFEHINWKKIFEFSKTSKPLIFVKIIFLTPIFTNFFHSFSEYFWPLLNILVWTVAWAVALLIFAHARSNLIPLTIFKRFFTTYISKRIVCM